MMRVNILGRFPILFRPRMSMDMNMVMGMDINIVLRYLLLRCRLPYGNGRCRR